MTANVVLGAGGPTGLECVKRLLAVTDTPVRAVVRDPAKYKDTLVPSDILEVVVGDVTDTTSLRTVLKDASGIIFAASGTTYSSPPAVDNQGVANVAEVAKEFGASQVVLVSSAMVTPKNGWNPIRMMLNNLRSKLMDHKFQGEEHLRKSGITYTVVRPGRLKDGPAGVDRVVAAQGDLARNVAAPISRSDVAAVCVEALRNPASHNVTLEIFSKGPLTGTSEENISTIFDGLQRDS